MEGGVYSSQQKNDGNNDTHGNFPRLIRLNPVRNSKEFHMGGSHLWLEKKRGVWEMGDRS